VGIGRYIGNGSHINVLESVGSFLFFADFEESEHIDAIAEFEITEILCELELFGIS
jgi:hypothetical protein